MKKSLLTLATIISMVATGCATTTNGSVVVNGTTVPYTINSNGKTPCTVFIHGNSADSSWMAPTIDKRRQQGKCVVSFDMPGHGKSGKLGEYPVTTMMDTIQKVIIDSGVSEKGYYMVGWSYGGDLTLHMLNSLPSGLKGIAIAGTSLISFSDRGLPSPTRDDSFLSESVVKNKYHLVGDLTNEQKQKLAKSFYCNYDSDCIVPKDLEKSVISTDNNVRSGIVASFGKGYVKDEFELMNNKPQNLHTCFVYGGKDALLNPDYMKAAGEAAGFDYMKQLDVSHSMFQYPDKMNNFLNECFKN